MSFIITRPANGKIYYLSSHIGRTREWSTIQKNACVFHVTDHTMKQYVENHLKDILDTIEVRAIRTNR